MGNAVTHILHLTIKIAATRTKPADAGYKTRDFTLVRAGGESSAASGFPDPGDWLSRWDLVCLAAILIVRAGVQDIR